MVGGHLEVHAMEGGNLRLISAGGPIGKRIGMTPDGKLIADLRGIHIPGRPEMPGVFVIESEKWSVPKEWCTFPVVLA